MTLDHNLDPEGLIAIHLELECIGLDAAGKLMRVPGPAPDDIPRLYVAEFRKGEQTTCLRYFRQDLPEEVCTRLAALPGEILLHQTRRVAQILEVLTPVVDIHYGKSYVFPMGITPGSFQDVQPIHALPDDWVQAYDRKLVGSTDPVWVVAREGKIVSSCQSSRENHRAGEAWVRTLPEYRQRGFARQVTAAWGFDLLQRGKIPFYSHKMENQASERVARSLGLIQYITDAAYG